MKVKYLFLTGRVAVFTATGAIQASSAAANQFIRFGAFLNG
jgi:hypothetical protein